MTSYLPYRTVHHSDRIVESSVIGLFGGIGAGSKFLQSLLDYHPDIYMIPGYSLLYFYPHFDELSRYYDISSQQELLIRDLLIRNPLYDTSILPGSETLHQLGEGQNESLSTDYETFLARVLGELDLQKPLTSRSLLVALHRAHFKTFATGIYTQTKNKLRILVHIHDETYLTRFVADFEDAQIALMTRQPSVNIPRRIKSSFNEANRDKLSDLDYETVSLVSIPVYSKYYYKGISKYQSIRQKIYQVHYEELLQDQSMAVNKLLDSLQLRSLASEAIHPTFANKVFSSSFYTRHRSLPLDTIRSQNIQLSRKALTFYDKLYYSRLNNVPLPTNHLKIVTSLCLPTTWELAIIKETYNLARISYLIKTLYRQVMIDSPTSSIYNPLHGFFRYKYSIPRSYLACSSFLARLQLQAQQRGKYPTAIVRLLRLIFHSSALLYSLTMLPLQIVIRAYWDAKLIFSAACRQKTSVHATHRPRI